MSYEIEDFSEGMLIQDNDGDFCIITGINDIYENDEDDDGEIQCMFFKDIELTIPCCQKLDIYIDKIPVNYIIDIIKNMDTMKKMKIQWLMKKYKTEIRCNQSH